MDIISHCVKRNQKKLQGRGTIGMLLILVVLSLLGWIYLTQASYVATTSRRVRELESEKERLQRENLQLMAQIAELESVQRLSNRAQELGFVAMSLQEVEFLVVGDTPHDQKTLPTETTLVAHWLDNVASQFTAWAQTETQ